VDEPTASLDPILRRRFWKEFEQLREAGRTIFVTTQYVGEAELCDRVGFLVDGELVAVGTPQELRRHAFGGEVMQLTLAGDPGHIGVALEAVETVAHVVEVSQEEDAKEPVSRVRLVSPDADETLPKVMEALGDIDVRSVDIPKPSFDEVFFRLVKEYK
jgi:ABC-2 type transport system ATP-binding protein